MIEFCSPENQDEWLQLRSELWPDDSKEDLLLDIEDMLAEPEATLRRCFA